MKKMYRFRGSLPLLLISAILILCAGFFIVSCGNNNSQQKTAETDKDSYGLDLSACPTGACTALPEGSTNTPIPSVAEREITLEAWVKKNKASALSGGVFSRMDPSLGVSLLISNNQPKFVIRRLPTSTDVQLTSYTPLTECTQLHSTSTECVVSAVTATAGTTSLGVGATFTIPGSPTTTLSIASQIVVHAVEGSSFTDSHGNIITLNSGTANSIVVPIQTVGPVAATQTFNVTVNTYDTNPLSLTQDVWTHIAGVVTTLNQSTGPNNCAVDSDGNGAVQGAEQPHLAIYINGELNNCATTNSTASVHRYAGNPAHENLGIGSTQFNETSSPSTPVLGNLDAVIDELRLWTTARTVADIAACKGTELGIGGTCNRKDDNLAAYYRLNEGEGTDVTDFSGNGFSGALEDGAGVLFDSGWVLRTDALTPTKED